MCGCVGGCAWRERAKWLGEEEEEQQRRESFFLPLVFSLLSPSCSPALYTTAQHHDRKGMCHGRRRAEHWRIPRAAAVLEGVAWRNDTHGDGKKSEKSGQNGGIARAAQRGHVSFEKRSRGK